jgi:hypothetical protein
VPRVLLMAGFATASNSDDTQAVFSVTGAK